MALKTVQRSCISFPKISNAYTHKRQECIIPKRGNGGNQFRQYAGQNIRNRNRIMNGMVMSVATRAEGNANGNNGNQIRCYNCRGLGHLARNKHIHTKEKGWHAYLPDSSADAQRRKQIQHQLKRFDLMLLQRILMRFDETDQLRYNFMTIAIMMRYLKCLLKRSSILSYSSPFLNHSGTNYSINDSNLTSVAFLSGETSGDSKQHPAKNKLHDMIYENAKLRAQLFDKVSEQKDTTRGTSANTKFAKQSILGKPPSSSKPKLYAVTPLPKSTAFPKVGEMNALSNQVTSNSVPSSQESNIMKNDNVLSPGIFRMNPFKASRVDNFVPNKHVKASVRTKPITVSQPHVITKNV
ncbi:hypothetical protein Tco_0836205 [Tanacetum coccineum]